MAVYNGDAEVGFAYWDARSAIKPSEAPDIGKKVVVFGLSQMYPNGGVVLGPEAARGPARQDHRRSWRATPRWTPTR